MSRKRKNSLTRQARLAYRQDELAHILTLPEQEFGDAFGMQTTEVEQRTPGYRYRNSEPEDYFHFRDNGANVLAVAHLDTVVAAERRESRFSNTQQAGPVVISGALDDRLGAYVILKLLPKLGVTCDWLLTVGEECGQSTAEYFRPEKGYDWVIEFDRAGTDVVMYDYEDRASRLAVEASGARMGHGSFSDICYLEHLGIKAFNWGVGYEGNYHSEHGYAFLNNTFTMVARYLRFHAQNAGTVMPHISEWPVYRQAHWWDTEADTGRRRETSGFIDCDSCGALQAVDPDTLICAYCDSCLNCGEESLRCTCPGGPGAWIVNPGSTLATKN